MSIVKFILSFLLASSLFRVANAQNLVMNPSFEDTIKLPDPYAGRIEEYAQYWQSPINHSGSPNYFHELAPLNGVSGLACQVPLNLYGFQYAQDGQAYCEFAIYAHKKLEYDVTVREFLTGTLSESLKAEKCYKMVFYVSMGENGTSMAISSLGVYFSDSVPIHEENLFWTAELDVEPQIEIDQWLYNMENWTKIERYFYAKGGEQYFTIGNFKSNLESAPNDTMFIGHNVNTQQYNSRVSSMFIDNVSIEEVPISSLGFENVQDITLCEGDTLAFTLPGDSAAIVWNNVSNDTLIVDSSGTYWYQAYKGCAYQTDTFQVAYISNERAAIETIELDTLYCGKEEIILDAGNDDPINAYYWNTGEETRQIIATEKGNYAVWIENQCDADSSTFQIEFNPQKINDYNIFTPNGDGENDFFTIYESDAEDYQLEIYNRWGRLIWETDNPNEHWDGGNVSDGVYYYHLSFNNCKNELIKTKGIIEVKR